VARTRQVLLDDGAVVVGHSVGGTILINALAERPPGRKLGAIVLIGVPVHVFRTYGPLVRLYAAPCSIGSAAAVHTGHTGRDGPLVHGRRMT
jgi:pimeloyl-ACP methyl ester carboxylesterase